MTNEHIAIPEIRDIEIERKAPEHEIVSACFSPCGAYLAATYRDEPPCIWNLVSGSRIELPIDRPALAVDFRSSAPEVAVAFGESLHQVQRFDLNFPDSRIAAVQISQASCARYSQDGHYLAAGNKNGTVAVWDLSVSIPGCRPKQVFYRNAFNKPVAALGFTAHNDRLVTAPPGGMPCAITMSDGKVMQCLRCPDGCLTQWDCVTLDCHPSIQKSAFGGLDGNVILLHHTMNEILMIESGLSFVRQVVFVPDFLQVAVVGDKGLEIWCTNPRNLAARWKPASGRVVAVRPIGDELFVAWG